VISAITLAHGVLEPPVYLPDATQAVVRSVDSADIEACGIQALVMNTFHLMQKPGSSTIQSLGGLHRMSGWPRPIITDSGGFQAYSLIHQNPKFGTLNEHGIAFAPEGSQRKFQLTPEKSVQLQFGYGADIIICLDDCTHVDASRESQQESVKRTVDWARRGKLEFERQAAARRLPPEKRPLLFAVIQGGGYLDLRRECAEKLLAIGFDGYGYGGWPLDGQGKLLSEVLGYTRQLVPTQFPMHALGVGHPENVSACWELGYELFDSAMPTRDARHGRLYSLRLDKSSGSLAERWLQYVYIEDEKHIKADGPLSPGCDCLCCARYSAGYLHHLFKIGDGLFPRLATIHNIRFMVQLTDRLRGRPVSGAPANGKPAPEVWPRAVEE
jgi:queuine tRNA-ribosyltransferase